MARLNHERTIDYVGRMAGTTLVKLRGYRLDLLEIEQNILIERSAAGIKDLAAACVVARTLNASIAGHTLADERQLIAFLVLRDSCSSQPAEVVSRLHRGLKETELIPILLDRHAEDLSNKPLPLRSPASRHFKNPHSTLLYLGTANLVLYGPCEWDGDSELGLKIRKSSLVLVRGCARAWSILVRDLPAAFLRVSPL
jgi:hypothetical protein